MPNDENNSVAQLLKSSRVVVCCGSGGVGKTTTSAALAMRAAMEGKRAVVITIDPAKRLATSLGLKMLSAKATDLTSNINDVLAAQGEKPLSGRFFAVMPDTAQTFESFVRAMAGDNENLAKRVLRTSIYKIFAKEYSGTNEYMAMEKLYELYNEKEYDLVVLDTPPAANTRTFLEAPRLLADFFDDRIMKWIIAPGSKFLASGLRKLLEILEKLTGHGFVSDLIEFTTALFELRAQFMENLHTVGKLLHQSDVSFLMVTSPERLSKSDTQEFVSILDERGYRFWGFVVNRVLGRRIGISSGSGADALDSEKWVAELKPLSGNRPAESLNILLSNFEQLVPTLEH
ncbi:MAG: ArsA family ATPase [Deltaproteobacteria bacterium]|nr:ArsA family ATPase [Deltaproteobacteria bacterium]